LLRAFAGIWPYARGQVERPLDAMFIPQRPYFPDGSLRDALAYPEPAASCSDAELKQVLREAQLPQLQERLDSQAAWNSSLSGGEQQRLSVARVLLKRPAWVFADEATSALDNAAEAQIYSRLVQLVQSRGGALVSVAHRDSVTEFHTARWLLQPQQGIREAGLQGAAEAGRFEDKQSQPQCRHGRLWLRLSRGMMCIRESLESEPMRVGVLTGGGDCPGLNAVIRAVTKSLINHGQCEVLGIADGFEGLMDASPRVRALSWDEVSGILHIGGTILGTSNSANRCAMRPRWPRWGATSRRWHWMWWSPSAATAP
jgi:hypothetical protein